MEAELEADLAEVHRLISLTASPLVRDRLHSLLDELLQLKGKLLGAAGDGHVLPQQPPPGAPLPMQQSGLQASGSAAALAVNDLADGFGRNVSLGSTNSGSQAVQGGAGKPLEANPMHRARSAADTGDTQSTNSAGAIEPIMSSSMVLANSQQQHMGLGTFDPIWQPGKVGPSRTEPPQAIDGLLTAQQLWQQAEAAGINYDSLVNGQSGLGSALNKAQHLQSVGSAGSMSSPMHLRMGSLGSAARQTLPPAHTQHSSLGVLGGSAPWMQPQHSQQHQQQQGFPTVTAPFGRGLLPGGHQQTQSPYGPPKQMLHNLPGSFGSNSGQGYAARMDHSRAMRGAGGGFGSGGLHGGNAAGAGGSAGLYGGNFQLPFNSAFPGAVHPSLQYGVDLRGGELDSMGMPLFRPLTTYSWEQSDGLVKIYVPLRGVQTELLRATFTLKSLEVRVVALQGKNYVYAVKSLFMPINVDGCHVAASKTKKNVLITLQKLRSETPEEKHWHDLTAP